jgi:hypothetical protein
VSESFTDQQRGDTQGNHHSVCPPLLPDSAASSPPPTLVGMAGINKLSAGEELLNMTLN